MANKWKGYLLKANGVKFPNKYILAESYSSTPKQREEVKAYRDENTRDLYRLTANGMKTTISFETTSLSLEQKIQIQNFFTDAETNRKERKVELTYWDDDNNQYDTGYFYRPNMEFVISEISESEIKYKGLKFELVEY